MKKFIILTIVLFASQASAAPFLVSDPQAGVVGYEITGLGEPVSFVAQADGNSLSKMKKIWEVIRGRA